MARIRFTRELTVYEHSFWFDEEDVPEILLPLFRERITLASHSQDVQDAVDDLLAEGDFTLGDTIGSSEFFVERSDP